MSVNISTPSNVTYVVQDLESLARRGEASTIAKFLSSQDLGFLRTHRTKIAAALVALPDGGGLAVAADLFSGRAENSPEVEFWTPLWIHVHNEITEARLATS